MIIVLHIHLLKKLYQSQTLIITIKKTLFIYCAPFTDCISEIDNTQIDNAQDIDAVMSMFNIIEYSDNYSKHVEVYGNAIEINQL